MLEPVIDENLMEVDMVCGSDQTSVRTSHDIGLLAMREQIKFMAEKLL